MTISYELLTLYLLTLQLLFPFISFTSFLESNTAVAFNPERFSIIFVSIGR